MSRVVRGLVQQQHVRLREQRLREQHAQLQSGRHLAHRSVVARLVDAGIGENAAGARLGVVAAVLREHRLELRRAHEVRIGGVRIGVDAVALGHRLPELGVALHHHVEDALILIAELILVQFAEAHPGLQHHIARARVEIPAEHLHERGLAGAVGADESVSVAVDEFDRDLLEQRLGAELHGNIGSGEHESRAPEWAAHSSRADAARENFSPDGPGATLQSHRSAP